MRFSPAYPIQEDFNTINPFSRPGIKLNTVNGVVWHYTGSKGEPTAKNIDNYFEGLKNQDIKDPYAVYAGAHVQIDRWSRVQSAPWDEMMYHCGATVYRLGIQAKVGNYPNAHLWGVEICEDANNLFPVETFENAVDLGAWFIIESRPGGILAKYVKSGGLTTKDFYRHFDITGKACPLPWINAGEPEWFRFLKAVDARVSAFDRGEDDSMDKVLEYPDWAWEQLTKWIGDAYNDGTIEDWDWYRLARDKELTYKDLLLLKILIDERRRVKALEGRN